MSLIQLRRGTAATWTSANPVLAAGEEGFETDTGLRKVGDGTTAWASLTYSLSGNVTGQSSSVDGEVALFSSTTGKVIKRSTLTGVPKLSSGVQSGTAAVLGDLGTTGADFSMNSHKLTSVTDPTSAQDAATKNYVDTRSFTANMGATTASVTNTTTDTTLWTPANVAAGSLVAGTTAFRIRFGGNFDNAATSGTFTAKIKVNGTTVASVPVAVTQTGAATATTWWADMDVFIDITGGSGAVTAQGYGVQITAAGGARNTIPVLTTTSALSLTGGCQFTLTGQMGTANASNTLRVFRAVINQIA